MADNLAATLLKQILPGARVPKPDSDRQAHTSTNQVFAEGIIYHGFDASGHLRRCVGRDAFFLFARECKMLMDEMRDEVVSISSVGPDVAILQARAHRQAKYTGERITYDYGMLVRVDNGQITYGADMIGSEATEFWHRAKAAEKH